MNNCNSCSPCGGCKPACAKPYFNLQADPFSSDHWLWEMGTENGRIKLPTVPVECPKLSVDYSNSTMTLTQGKCDPQTLTGAQIGSIINLNDLRDVDASSPDACSLLVFNPGCGLCPCSPDEMMWKKYVIPDAGDCEMEPDEDGYYKVLKKTDCGCITECRLPVVPNGMVSLNYVRDSVPDDPDFPWYYGCYNDKINLYLQKNASKYFGKYALKVTVNYGIQACKSDATPGYNFRSLVVPVVDGEPAVNVEKEASVLQGFAIYSSDNPQIPWGTMEMRGSFTFIVPKGKEAYLHHEYRLRTSVNYNSDWQNWTFHELDGKRVPESEASSVDKMKWAGSRLHSLQVLIEPTMGTANFDPVVDDDRNQLDAPVDEYPIN